MGERDNPAEKVVIDEEELDSIEIHVILSLKNLPRAVFIDWGCWNLGVIVGGRGFTRSNNKERQTFYKPINVHYVTYTVGGSVSSTSM